MPMEIFRVFRLEASHHLPALPEGHPCRKVHGHSWRVEIRVRGAVEPASGFVMDFADLERAFIPLLRKLDHAHLNDIPGLDHPTSENLALWIWRGLAPAIPALARVTVQETEACGCVLRAEDFPRG